jgi:hypothetical protein
MHRFLDLGSARYIWEDNDGRSDRIGLEEMCMSRWHRLIVLYTKLCMVL